MEKQEDAPPSSDTPQPYDFLCVLDFEATCEDNNRKFPQEIIEFPVVVVDTKTYQTVTEFHTYVKPVVHPTLTKFCTQLTGITQAVVDNAPTWPKVQSMFNSWLSQMEQSTFKDRTYLFVTCGDWDLNQMLPAQLKRLLRNVSQRYEVPQPNWAKHWCNIKVVATNLLHEKMVGMAEMLKRFGLPLLGRHHSGIDDSRNIAACAVWLMQHGAVFQVTRSRNVGGNLAVHPHRTTATHSPV